MVVAREDVVAAGLDDGVHGPGEGFTEGPSPVLRYGMGDAAANVGVIEDGEPHLWHLVGDSSCRFPHGFALVFFSLLIVLHNS